MLRKSLYLLLSVGSLSVTAAEKLPEVSFITPSIARIRWTVNDSLRGNDTGVTVYGDSCFTVNSANEGGKVVYSTSELLVEMDKRTGALVFKDRAAGKLLLAENADTPRSGERVVSEKIVYDDASARMEETANGKVTVKDVVRRDTVGVSTRYVNNFAFSPSEALYGLGSHMEDYMDLNGKTLYLTQHNLKATVPVIVSTGGYGILFDAGCAMKFDAGSVTYEAAAEVDYYFMKGERLEDVVAQYRYLTGGVSMMPRYIFGYIQSKERYVSSDDLLSTLAEYRRRHVPVDMIVQDWNYWPEGWGYMKMDSRYYPDPKALADSVHSMNARLMVSIWPNPQYCPQERDFREKGYMLEHSVYDAFNPAARRYYWSYADREFFSRGFDAWWCDSSEPLDGDWNRMPEPVDGKDYGWDDHERRWHLNKDILSDALGMERSSLYSLYHSRGIYENQRLATDRKRVVNLTRSSYSGQQRYGTIVWNGDTHASWRSFRQQIPSGLNYMATGNPYWTVDVGSFFTARDGRWFRCGDFPAGVDDDGYKEYYVRMFQWATFLPVLRSHGSDTPREIWRFGEPGSKYYDAILGMIELRYRLIPYIYSLAFRQTLGGYSIARHLAFDFADDVNVRDIKDEYMFGDILVCPVTYPGAVSRKVYLPALDGGRKWIDYFTGESHDGGRWIDCDAPLGRIPLFVRGGSIIAGGDAVEYADAQIGGDITVNVYPGADAEFMFYEDEGDNYNFEKGSRMTVAMAWNDGERTLKVGSRCGEYPGMPSVRTLRIVSPYGEKTVDYDGTELTIRL
ncbi:DUF5110 domain-containing protein [Barnesiella sp. WM24]|uniref:glycoside hydrolase family 31 protein n=1 Tax=Barnesiella sp. WM24 TaxID=2558278 RepID=UPI001072B867|nr:TIM-barrel domain-containing protein [Barnesiella sp. WM24]TFU91813.1 DUF5110 domain-containing protein [Barnesiella sp. WM24]